MNLWLPGPSRLIVILHVPKPLTVVIEICAVSTGDYIHLNRHFRYAAYQVINVEVALLFNASSLP